MGVLCTYMNNLTEFYSRFPDEKACISYLAKARWGETAVCPHCQNKGAYFLQTRKIYKCNSCIKQFTVRIGTIFEDSRIPLQKWFLAIYLLTSLKKGISSIQMAKYLGITQKSAWFMLHRVRYAVNSKQFNMPLKGDVEIDETYMGGKRHGKRGRGAVGKTPIVGLVERKGDIKVFKTEKINSLSLTGYVYDHVARDARVLTDDFGGYNYVKLHRQHETVAHGRKEYVRGDVHTNTIEGFWSHLKRGVRGVYLQVSKKHMQRYCDEFAYRYNTRNLTDTQRFENWFTHEVEKITYKGLTA